MNETAKKNLTSKEGSALFRSFTIGGVLLFLLGAGLAIVFGPHFWITVLRWVGLLAIAAAGVLGGCSAYWIFLFLLGAGLAIVFGPQFWITVLRWVGLLAIAAAGLRGPSLTSWILFSILPG